jgi:hypothetical protein
MTDYRYVFSSLRNEQVIEEISLYGVYMDLALNFGGQFNGTFQLDQEGKMNSALLDATVPGKTYVAVERNGIPIWVGMIWSRTYQSQSKSMQIFAQSFENYPKYQLMETDFSRTGMDQRNVFCNLWTDMQSVYGRNININIPSTFTPTARIKDISVLASDTKYYIEAMKSIADGADGFDWYIGVSKQGNYYVKNLVIGYPNLGIPEIPYMTVFEYPGSITNYYDTESMADAGTDIFLIGSGEGSDMLLTKIEQTSMIDDGWPRYDQIISQKDIDDHILFEDLAAREVINRRPPMEITKITVKADKTPDFGSWNLGDTVKVVINDARFPNGMQKIVKIVKWELHPQQSEGTEEANIIFQGDEDG